PISSTTPSIGLPRMDSSTSMLARLRKSIAVGRSWDSPNDITGNSSGKPPASHTPRLTHSASSRKCALQGFNSEKVLQMPMTGRPSNRSCGHPWFFIQLRWPKPSRSFFPNQPRLRSVSFVPSALLADICDSPDEPRQSTRVLHAIGDLSSLCALRRSIQLTREGPANGDYTFAEPR